MASEGVELPLPEASVASDPFCGVSHGPGAHTAAPDPAVLRADEEACILQDPKVLRDGGQRHVEGPGQLCDRGLPSRQPRQDGPSGGIRQGPKGRIQCGIHIVNHMVKYCRGMAGLSSGIFGFSLNLAKGAIESL